MFFVGSNVGCLHVCVKLIDVVTASIELFHLLHCSIINSSDDQNTL